MSEPRAIVSWMTRPVVTVEAHTTLATAEALLARHGISALVVTSHGGELAGVLSRSDLLALGRRRARMAGDPTLLHLPRHDVGTHMVRDVVVAAPEEPIERAAARMIERHVHRVVVVHERQPVGVLSSRDLLRAVHEARLERPLSSIMSSPVRTVSVSEPVAVATDRLTDAGVQGLVVVEDGWPIGVFSQTEAMTAHHAPRTDPVEEHLCAAMLCLSQSLPIHRAAKLALGTRARRVLACEGRELVGIASPLDFVRVIARG